LSDSPRATDVLIRAARPEDVRRVLALWDQARSPAAVTPDDVRSVSRLIAHGDDALLVAEHDGEIVGSLIAAWDGWRGNMYRLAVLPHLRRQGIAARLVQAGHEHLRGKGARRVTALVAHEEEDAVRLWESAGYHRDEQIARFVRNL
jgi:ribosomal protein S18 acetylase RimI-like enzyme